ncbi:MAG: hypothetical protein GX638_06690 [Crenarchaeota archaeon]|nr:hypothetical protein [Thermoproteota archaeon]
MIPKNRLFFEVGKHLGTLKFIEILFFGFLYEMQILPLKQALKHIYWLMRDVKINWIVQILEKIPLLPDVEKTCKNLKLEGYMIILISSGLPNILVDEIASKIGADYSFGIHLENRGEFFTGKIKGEVIEQNGKIHVLKNILQKEKLSLKDCIMIADDRNNKSLFVKEALKIAYNPDYLLRIKADVVITGKFSNLVHAIKKETDFRVLPNKKDLTRELIHASGIFVPFIAMFTGKTVVGLSIALIMVAYCVSEYLRLHGKALPFFSNITLWAASPYELYEIAFAPLYYGAGILFTLLLFPHPASSAAIAMFALGDSSASIIGASISKRRLIFNRSKTLEGSLGGFLFAFLAGLLFVPPVFSLIGAAIAMIVEYLPWPINDNLMIPLTTGLFLTLII